MSVSLQKAAAHGVTVRTVCITEALRVGEWIHRNGVMFASPELRDDIATLWPSATFERPIGIITDVPETVN